MSDNIATKSQKSGDGAADYWAVRDELNQARRRIAELEERLSAVLEWWPEGSETGRLGKGGSFASDIQSARAALAKGSAS